MASPINLIMPTGTYCKSRSSKSSNDQHKPDSIQACNDRVKSGSSDPSVLVKTSCLVSSCKNFMRPYAMFQVIISAICIFARVLVENPQLFKWSLLIKAFPCLIAIALLHACCHCLNDIYDADIDRINKPYLPIPSGELSLNQAWFSVIFDVFAGLMILWLMNADRVIFSLYDLALFFGTFYSAPPLRFKNYSVTAIIVIPLTSILHNVGIYYASRTSLGLQFLWSPPIVFLTIFVTWFFVAINIAKDLSDVEGDIKHDVRTFAAIFGLRNILVLSTGMLLANYIGAIVIAIYMPQAFKRDLMLSTHAICALWLFFEARKLDKANYTKEASTKFYQFIWMLLNFEFLLLPFI